MTDLRIGHLANRYVLPRDPQRSAALQAKLDRAATEFLGEALDNLAGVLPELTRDEVWLVRHLHVEFAVGIEAAADPGVMARAWSQRLLVALRSALAGGDAEVVHFASRAAWTARFVSEVAAGTAWDRWYLGAFTSLRALPTGRAIAEAVTREPGEATAVLAELSRGGELERVLMGLGEGDARRILHALASPGELDAVGGRSFARALADLAWAIRAPDDPHLPGSVVRLLATAVARGVALPPGAVASATAVVVLAGLLAEGADPREVAAALGGRRWASALRLAGRSARDVTADELAAAELLHSLADEGHVWLTDLASALTPGAPDTAGVGQDAAVLATRFGGLLLLWPLFMELWAHVEGDAPLHRLLAAAHLFGHANIRALLRDPVLALLCGLDRPPAPSGLEQARSGLPVEALRRAAEGGPAPDPSFCGDPTDPGEAAAARFCAMVLQRFGAKLPGFAGSSPGYLLRNFLDVPATVRLGEDTWHAHITGPPLQVVLRMAGLSCLTYRLPWPPTVEITTELAWS